MPKVTLRGSKTGHRVSRLILEGSSSNPIRQLVLNGEPLEVTDEEFAKWDRSYVLELAASDGKPDDTEQPPPPEADEVEDDGDNNEDDEK